MERERERAAPGVSSRRGPSRELGVTLSPLTCLTVRLRPSDYHLLYLPPPRSHSHIRTHTHAHPILITPSPAREHFSLTQREMTFRLYTVQSRLAFIPPTLPTVHLQVRARGKRQRTTDDRLKAGVFILF